MRHRFRSGAPAARCARCTLPTPEGGCGWCGHDPTDPTAAAALEERRRALVELRRDRSARRAWLATEGRVPFLSCPACRQRTEAGLCEHCHFGTTDDHAIAALDVAADTHRAQRRDRRAALRVRLAPPSRWAALEAGVGGERTAPRFMTCPACHQWSPAPTCEWCGFDTTDADAVHHLIEEQRFAQRRWAVRRHRAYSTVRGLLRVDVAEQVRPVSHLARWVALGAVVGVLAGVASAAFLEALDWATRTRETYSWLLFGLPLAGFAVGLAYHYGGGRAAAGNNLIIDEIHDPQAWVPRRMAPLVFVGTVATHLFGGSAGREGTAIQMSGSLTDGFARVARIAKVDRRLLLIAGGAGVIGAAFALKLLFTSITLGSGFQGGEVTPLFVIGATLGATLGHLLGVPVPLLAAIGFVAVFAGATNTPLACTIMGVELFGAGPIVLLAVACIASYVVTGERGIYATQRVDTPKTTQDHEPSDTVTLHALAQQRRHWLPAPTRPIDDEAAG